MYIKLINKFKIMSQDSFPALPETIITLIEQLLHSKML